MKISLLQENLAKAVGIASRMVASKTQLPVLSNILLKTEKGKIKLAATNLETGINLWLGAKIEKQGGITVPARIFGELINSLPQDTVNMEVKEDKLKINCGSVKAVINGIGVEEFPKMPTMKNKKKEEFFEIDAEKLAKIVKQTAFAAGVDEGRPIFTGVKLEIKRKSARLAATDGYRLSIGKIKGISGVKKEKELVVPAKALIEITKIMVDTGEGKATEKSEKIKVMVTDKGAQMIMAGKETEIVTRLIEGEFPDFEKIVPASSVTQVELDKESLLRGVRSAAIFAKDSANIVKFKIEKDGLKIGANAPQVGENEVGIEGKKTGDDGEIAFNCRYLLEMLMAVDGERIILETGGALSPGVFRILGDEDFLHIIMPVRVQN